MNREESRRSQEPTPLHHEPASAAGRTSAGRHRTETAWLWAALALPSIFIVDKLFGWSATAIYAIVAGLAVVNARWIPVPRSRGAQLWAALFTAALVVVVFILIYPRVNVHAPPGGSDDDDAYNLGARALFAGRSPYAERTYLGNVLHQFPGAFVLAAPFVALGTSALQNLFWLAMFFVAMLRERLSGREALRLAWLVLGLSPVVMHQVVTGTAHMANAIYVLLGLWWLTRTRHRDVAAVAWGVALASRANFLFLVPLAFGWLAQHHGRRAAVRATLLTLLTGAAITLPFYFAAPDSFGPLEAADRVTRFNDRWPHAGDALLGVMAILACGLAARQMDREALFRNAAIVQAFPVVAGTVMGLAQWHHVDLAYTSYFAFAAPFVLMASIVSTPQAFLASAD